MDIGGGYYRLALSVFTIGSAAVHLLGILLVSLGLISCRRLRRGLVATALLLLSVNHALIAWQGFQIWHDVFLGVTGGQWGWIDGKDHASARL